MGPITSLTDPRELRVADYRLDQLWRQWLAARAGRLMPARRAIDAAAMPAALPHLFLYDYRAANGRFFCRLSGEEINVVTGVNCANHYLDQIFPAHIFSIVHARYDKVVHTPTLAYMHGVINMANGAHVPGERLILPLSDDGRVATGLIGGAVYRRPDSFKASAWVDEPLVEANFAGLPPADWSPPGPAA